MFNQQCFITNLMKSHMPLISTSEFGSQLLVLHQKFLNCYLDTAIALVHWVPSQQLVLIFFLYIGF